MSSTTDALPAATWRTYVRRWLKPVAFTLSLLPFLWAVVEGINLFVNVFPNTLGANPIEAIIRFLGDWALRFILIALAVTPLRLLTGWNEIGRLRRMLGLFAFFYVVVHVFGYVVLDQFFDWKRIGADIVKRTFITFGMFALTMLIPLAITSTDKMARRLGGKRWRQLHMLVYPAAIAGVIHYYFMVKADTTQPLIYGAILAALFAVRLYKKWV